jgi:hypothetical protein
LLHRPFKELVEKKKNKSHPPPPRQKKKNRRLLHRLLESVSTAEIIFAT